MKVEEEKQLINNESKNLSMQNSKFKFKMDER